MSINFNAILYHKTSILTNQKLLLKKGKLENLFFIKNIAIIGKRFHWIKNVCSYTIKN